MIRIEHLETRVQHEFVVRDDATGKILRRVVEDPHAVTPEDWADYSGKTFPRELAAVERDLNAQAPKPNRAARRAKTKSVRS